MSSPSQPYISKGQVLSSPPISARIQQFMNHAYIFMGLYVTSLFSLDPYAAAQSSQFNIQNRSSRQSGPAGSSGSGRGPWGGGGGGGGGSGGGGGGGGWGRWGGGGGGGTGPGGKRVGRVDDVRGPECRSCG